MKLCDFKEKSRKNNSDFIFKPICYLTYRLRFRNIALVGKNITIKISDVEAWYWGNKYSEFTFCGIIMDGDWSRKITSKEKLLEKSPKYRAGKQRYKDNTP